MRAPSPASPATFGDLFSFLADVDRRLLDYLGTSHASLELDPPHLKDSVWSYVRRPAKRLRPGLVLLACEAVGGDPEAALPAAAAVEIFHTWTLVHDDVIDNDALRRGAPTVHTAAAAHGREAFGLDPAAAAEYGRNVAILTGDAQNGWSTALFAESGFRSDVSPLVVLRLVHHLQSKVVSRLLSGETLDVEYGLGREGDARGIDEAKILQMLWLKTGVLCEFAGLAGGMIGKNTDDFGDAQATAIARFAGECGIAFQLQDDIIGILGDEADTGKPKGSDVREGKLTLIVHEALQNARPSERDALLSVLGHREASDEAVARATATLVDLGGVERASGLATRHVREALPYLDALAESEPKRLLRSWAEFMIDRRF